MIRISRRRVRGMDFTRSSEEVEETRGALVLRYLTMRERPRIVETDDDIRHEVVKGDRLDQLAHRYYGDFRLWWVLADANSLTLPFVQLYPGRILNVPNPRYVKERLVR